MLWPIAITGKFPECFKFTTNFSQSLPIFISLIKLSSSKLSLKEITKLDWHLIAIEILSNVISSRREREVKPRIDYMGLAMDIVNEKEQLKKYNNIYEIIKEYYSIRIEYYNCLLYTSPSPRA